MPAQEREQRERDTHTQRRGKWSEREDRQAGREIRRNGEKCQQEAFHLNWEELNILSVSEAGVLMFCDCHKKGKKKKMQLRFSTRK